MSTTAPKPAVLGIDWGSTAIRGILVPRGNLPAKLVWNHGAIPGHDQTYQKGAFKSSIYVDGVGPSYLGEHTDHDRISVPSKLFFLKHPVTGVESVDKALRGPDACLTMLLVDAGMRKVLRTVLAQAVKTCEQKTEGGPFFVDDIGLSYSAHWTDYERSKYHDLFTEVLSEFDVLKRHSPRINFVAESLSSAHNLFSNESHIEQVLGYTTEPTLLVFLDFGGHTLNGCMFSVARRDDSNLCYLRVGDTFATKGGTQAWEQEIGRMAAEAFRKDWNKPLPPKQCAELLESFHSQIKKWKCNTVSRLGLPYTSLDMLNTHFVNIPAEDVSKCFWRALKGPIGLAIEKINEAYSFSDNVQVVVSGGSGKNSVLQACIKDACDRLGIPEPYFFYETAGEHDSWNIAKGAAICTANDPSVEDFLNNGAAFGFQKSFFSGRNPNYHDNWSGNVMSALGSAFSQPFKAWFSGRSRLKIVCNPSQRSDTIDTALDMDNTYDIVELPTPLQGYWEHCLKLEKLDGAVSLIVQRYNCGKNGKRTGPSTTFPRLRLYFDQSSNCCLIDTDVDDKGRGLRMSESGFLEPCSEEAIQNQVMALQHAKGRHPPKRRLPDSQKTTANKRPPGQKPHRATVFDPARFKPKDAAVPAIGQPAGSAASSSVEPPERAFRAVNMPHLRPPSDQDAKR